MPDEHTAEPVLAHILFMDIIGCSKLSSGEQTRIIGRLQEIVRASPEFRAANDAKQVISLPTGDGMALAFLTKFDAPVLCAIEISKSIRANALCQIRMGIHSGLVFVVEDINHKRNLSGAGINRAERVMSCGEDGHILLSDSVVDSLRHLSGWQSKWKDVGECRAKDGWIHLWSYFDGAVGNSAIPRKSKRIFRRRRFLKVSSGGVAAAAVLAGVGGAFWFGRHARDSRNEDRPSIAVLPFEDLSAAKDQVYFSDGLAEELLNGLARIPGLKVAGRSSSFQFAGKSKDYRAISEKLKVSTVLDGSVRRQGTRAKIGAQLIDAKDGYSIWSESYDRDLGDIFGVQEDIARRVTGELKVKLLGTKTAARTTSPAAYEAYLQGRHYLAERDKQSLEKAAGYFSRASGIDSGYAPAWVGLGDCLSHQAAASDLFAEEGFRRARAAVDKALALDPDFGEAHAVLGFIRMTYDWDWTGADASYKEALKHEPGSATVISGAARLNRVLGRLDESIALYRRALEIDPLDARVSFDAGRAYYNAARYDEAQASFNKALELVPDMAFVHGWLGRVYLAQARPREALAEAEREVRPLFHIWGRALAYHALHWKKESDESLAELIAKFQKDAPYQIAKVYAFRGETDRAFEWLDRAYAGHDVGLSEMKGDPMLKSLEKDPRYIALVRKAHLPD